MPNLLASSATWAPSPFDWSKPEPWTCPSCGAVTLTREVTPWCVTCGHRDDLD